MSKMYLKMRECLGLVLLAFVMSFAMVMSLPAFAQNPAATPINGDIRLASGFLPDPYEIRLQAGGPIDAGEELHPSCAGFIASAPDLNLHFQGSGNPLLIYVESESDTMLIVQNPDDQWFCEDDNDGLNPVMLFREAPSGRYTIWVGTYRNSGNVPATLKISETGQD